MKLCLGRVDEQLDPQSCDELVKGPEADGCVSRRREEGERSLRVESQTVHISLMLGDGVDAGCSPDVPQLDGGVPATRDEQPRQLRVEGDGPDIMRMAL